ncbi:hypothetical protein F2P81_009925 [Scophthalmus maximus]|uniref:SUN domain-containing protein n=1 Tax=Scophthalmus maximus TaxID=52904 RepID=A0A6A4T1D4_SCOMX|nr:hypothetical protein F2P81_009925 [Scophthalmus maximus]
MFFPYRGRGLYGYGEDIRSVVKVKKRDWFWNDGYRELKTDERREDRQGVNKSLFCFFFLGFFHFVGEVRVNDRRGDCSSRSETFDGLFGQANCDGTRNVTGFTLTLTHSPLAVMSRRSSRLMSGGYYHSDEESDSSSVTNISYREIPVKLRLVDGRRSTVKNNASESFSQHFTQQSREEGLWSVYPPPPPCSPILRLVDGRRSTVKNNASESFSQHFTQQSREEGLWSVYPPPPPCSPMYLVPPSLVDLLRLPHEGRKDPVTDKARESTSRPCHFSSSSSSTQHHASFTCGGRARPQAELLLKQELLYSQAELLLKQELLYSQMKERIKLDMQGIKSSLEVVDLDSRLRLEQEIAGLGRQMVEYQTDSRSAAASLSSRIRAVEAENAEVKTDSLSAAASLSSRIRAVEAENAEVKTDSRSAAASLISRIQAVEAENAKLSQQLVSIQLIPPPAPCPETSTAPVHNHLTPELQQAMEKWLTDRIKERDVLKGSGADFGRPMADKMADFALETQGASVISTRCSETYHIRSACVTLFGFPLWYPSESPRTVIQGYPVLLPGKCWAFNGVQGTLVISLSHPVRITHVTLDHLPRYNSPTGRIDSAPKDFEVYGTKSDTQEGTLLGTFTYNENGESTQTFQLPNPSDEVYRFVELHVLSNWGHVEYTCLYRFRVHGKIATTSSRLLSSGYYTSDEVFDTSSVTNISYRENPFKVFKNRKTGSRTSAGQSNDSASLMAVAAKSKIMHLKTLANTSLSSRVKKACGLFLLLLLAYPCIWFLLPLSTSFISHMSVTKTPSQTKPESQPVIPATPPPPPPPLPPPPQPNTVHHSPVVLSQQLVSIQLIPPPAPCPETSTAPVHNHLTPELQEAMEKWLNDRFKGQDVLKGSNTDFGRPMADKMADFALETQGASVISSRCSETYRIRSACVTLFGFPLWYPYESPRTVIQGYPVLLPGKCWAFHGVQGTLTISLSHPVRITHVTLDHLPRYISPTGRIDSAPKDFEVYGMKSYTEKGTLLGTFTYNEKGESSQTFQLPGYPVLLPGKCWAFHGVQGTLTISLSHPVRITHVTLDHLPRYISPTGRIDSAPKDFEVYGMKSYTEKGTLLGTFTYNEKGESSQTFQLPSPSDEVYRFVELHVLSNWGRVEYTCLYRFRVHGKIATT